jgi:CBS domain-containing protein
MRCVYLSRSLRASRRVEMKLKCNGIMSESPTVCVPTDSVVEVARLMKESDVGSIPVVEDRTDLRLIGIVTDRDLAMRVIAEGLDASATSVVDVMSRNLTTVGPDDDVDRAMDAMGEQQVRRVPVVDADNRLVGIIAQADIAARMEAPEKTAEVVEEISKP